MKTCSSLGVQAAHRFSPVWWFLASFA